MNTIKILGISIIFLLGFISANFVSYYVYDLENPLGLGFLNSGNGSAPFDLIGEKDIEVYDDKVVINIEGASISRYAATGSMKPVLDEGSNGIRIKPNSEEDIHVGDIVTFKEDDMSIVHRVIEKGADEKGIYFITKGDNNSVSDRKIRFKNIEYITIGVIW